MTSVKGIFPSFWLLTEVGIHIKTTQMLCDTLRDQLLSSSDQTKSRDLTRQTGAIFYRLNDDDDDDHDHSLIDTEGS